MEQVGCNSPLDTRRGACVTLAAWTAFIGLSPLLLRVNAFLAGLLRMPDCLLLEVTGLNCPLCGGTRCIAALSRGDLISAFYYNPLVLAAAVVAVLLGGWILLRCVDKAYRRPWPKDRTVHGLWVLLGVLILFCVLRNLPFYRTVLY